VPGDPLVSQLGKAHHHVPLENLRSGGEAAVHHVAYAVPRAEVEALRSELDRRGLPTYLSAQLGEVENTFHDASASLGHDVEVQVDSAEFREFFEMVRRGAEDWDGADPLRPVGT
jgi:hypothetical protein